MKQEKPLHVPTKNSLFFRSIALLCSRTHTERRWSALAVCVARWGEGGEEWCRGKAIKVNNNKIKIVKREGTHVMVERERHTRVSREGYWMSFIVKSRGVYGRDGSQDISQTYMIIKLLFNFDLSECPINHFPFSLRLFLKKRRQLRSWVSQTVNFQCSLCISRNKLLPVFIARYTSGAQSKPARIKRKSSSAIHHTHAGERERRASRVGMLCKRAFFYDIYKLLCNYKLIKKPFVILGPIGVHSTHKRTFVRKNELSRVTNRLSVSRSLSAM